MRREKKKKVELVGRKMEKESRPGGLGRKVGERAALYSLENLHGSQASDRPGPHGV